MVGHRSSLRWDIELFEKLDIWLKKVYLSTKVCITLLLHSIIFDKAAMKEGITSIGFLPLDIIKKNAHIEIQPVTVLHH